MSSLAPSFFQTWIKPIQTKIHVKFKEGHL